MKPDKSPRVMSLESASLGTKECKFENKKKSSAIEGSGWGLH